MSETPQPVPPTEQPPKEDPKALSFEQLIRGIHKYYKRFQENELAYRQINDTIKSEKPSAPTCPRAIGMKRTR